MSKARPHYIYLALLLLIAFCVAYFGIINGTRYAESLEKFADRFLYFSAGSLLVLFVAGFAFRARFGDKFSLSGCATLIQGLSIALMICSIAVPLRMIFKEPKITPESLIALAYPTAEALIVMALGVGLAVVMNFIDDHLTPPTRLEVNIDKIDFGELQSGLAQIDRQLKEANRAVTGFAANFNDATVKIGALVDPLERLRVLVGNVGALVEEMNVFFSDASRERR